MHGKQAIIKDGYVINKRTYEIALQEAKFHMKNQIFGGIIHYVITFLAGIIPYMTDYIPNAIAWFAACTLFIYLFLHFYSYISQAWNWKKLSKENPLIWILIAILFGLYFNHEFRMQSLETRVDQLTENVKYLDDKVTTITKTMETYYTPFLQQETWVKTFDHYLITTLEKLGISRQKLNFGCFITGTQIQLDKYGKEWKNIEQLKPGDLVFSPLFDKQIKIIPIYGNETGYMYEIITNDSLSMIVTKNHPLLVYDNGMAAINMAAKNVYAGNITKTVNGFQIIEQMNKIYVNDEMVYNLWLDIPNENEYVTRAVVANGIYSLDFIAQKEHEK